MEWLLGIIFESIVAGIVGGAMGSISTLGGQRVVRHFARKGLDEKVKDAYFKYRKVCESDTLDPAHPGNPNYMKAEARDSVIPLSLRFKRAGFQPPMKCDTSEESLQEWFVFLRQVLYELG